MPPRTTSSADTYGRAGAIAAGAAFLVTALTVPGAAIGNGAGGVQYVPVPEIAKVTCAGQCASGRRPRAGGRVRISGRNLSSVRRVVFQGGPGRQDDAVAKVRPRSDRRITLTVPMNARSGPVAALAGAGISSRPSRAIPVLPPLPPALSPALTPVPGPRDPGAPRLETGTSQAKYFFGSERLVTFSYRVSDDAPAGVQIDLMRAQDGAVIRRWAVAQVPPGQVQTVAWDGFDAQAHMPPEGRYVFRAVASGASGAQVRSAQVQDVQRDAFDFYRHIFPVRGRHDFGGSGARFGASRAGHSHQGQDVFARCGTRLVAARGGVVKFKQYHSAAGHYLVIDGDGTGVDYAYMHLVSASPFNVGDHVHTGQEIGQVGDSGNASGCHLHFEMWDAPGWYDGGHPFDPYPFLVEWDAVS